MKLPSKKSLDPPGRRVPVANKNELIEVLNSHFHGAAASKQNPSGGCGQKVPKQLAYSPLANADGVNGYLEFFGDGHKNAATGCTIQFCHNEAGNASDLGEDISL